MAERSEVREGLKNAAIHARGDSPRHGGGQLGQGWRGKAPIPLAVLVGSLFTLALLTVSRSNVGIPWREGGFVTPSLSTHVQAQRAQAQAAKASVCPKSPACPDTPACPACPKAKPCPPEKQCPVCPEQPAAGGKAAAGTKQAAAALDEWAERLRVPWGPMLTQEEAMRGQTYYGSGKRLQAVVAKLMAGKPIKVFTLGASVTRGIGSSDRKYSYPSRFFEYINTTFPHKGHKFVNRGIGGTSSAIYSVCAEHMVDKDADIVVLEFTANDLRDAPFTHSERKGHEQLIRKLSKLPGRPAIIQLHHWCWWHAVGDGLDDPRGGLFYWPAGEAQLSVFAHYYDFPSVSVRAAMWQLMRARVDGFNPDAARQPEGSSSPTGVPMPAAERGKEKLYWYKDRSHPGDEGHTMMAELLSHVLARAVLESVAPRPVLHLGSRKADLSAAQDEDGLPLPMIPGNAATPTSLCAIEEDFEGVVTEHSGDFSYKPEKPDAKNFVEQKWGWSATKPGSWVEMEFDSAAGWEPPASTSSIGSSTGSGRAEEQDGEGGEEGEGDTSQDAGKQSKADQPSGATPPQQEQDDGRAEVTLSYLKSYSGMGVADVECVAGCDCEGQVLDGTWEQKVSLQQIVQFRVTRHKRCRVRVTVAARRGATPQEGHKVVLTGVMVSQFSVRLNSYEHQVDVLSKTVG